MSASRQRVIHLIAVFAAGFVLAIAIVRARHEHRIITSTRINAPDSTAMADVELAPARLVISGWHRAIPSRLASVSSEQEGFGWDLLQSFELSLIETQPVDLSFLRDAQHLRHITIVGAVITRDDLRLLLTSADLTEVRLVECGNVSEALRVLQRKNNINVIDLSSSEVSDSSLRDFATTFSGTLRRLNVAGAGISDETISLLRDRFSECRLTVNSTWYDQR